MLNGKQAVIQKSHQVNNDDCLLTISIPSTYH